MRIPEKYRERYDRLAMSHPWMREMRDETNGIDGETNGIADEITLPDGDAVAILRKVAADKTDVSSDDLLRYAVGADMVPDALDTIADMVERDYVKLSEYGRAIRDAQELYLQVECERDEAIEAYDKHMAAHDAWHEPEDIKYTRNRFSALEKAKNERIAKLEAERDELKAKVEEIMGEPDYMEAWERMHEERDEWKAKAEHCRTHMDKMIDAIATLTRKQPMTFDPEAPYENAELVAKYIDELKEKAEGQSKVRASKSNLEWLYENDDEFAYHVDNWVIDDGYGSSETWEMARKWLMAPNAESFARENCTNLEWLMSCAGIYRDSNYEKFDNDVVAAAELQGFIPHDCKLHYQKHEWLLSPHVDDNDDLPPENGVRAGSVDANDANAAQDSRDSRIRKGLGYKDVPPHEPSDATKRFIEELDDELDSREKLCTLDVYEDGKLHSSTDIPKSSWEHDSREKLEADVRNHFWHADWCRTDMVLKWLDRQAAITKSEWAHVHDMYIADLRKERDEAEKRATELQEELTEWKHSHPLSPNKPDSQSDAPKSEETAENATSKCGIHDFADSREKLEEDLQTLTERWHDYGGNYMRIYSTVAYEQVKNLLDRQAAITANEISEGNIWFEALLGSNAELQAEADYWKQEVQNCLDCAYPQSHSPERRYDPNVMGYPDRKNCTTPSTLVCAVIDGLRDEKGEQYMALLNDVHRLECENKNLAVDLSECMEAKGKLEDELKAIDKRICELVDEGAKEVRDD